MASGDKQPKWDVYEAVILLDGYLELIQRKQPKNRVIKRVSADLRQMAVNRGNIIDDRFRNENGISYQIQSMESAYKGYKVNVPATKLFLETVRLFREDKKHFNMILENAKNMIASTKSNKESFLTWVASYVSAQRYKWVNDNILCVERFGKVVKIINKSIYDITDIAVLNILYRTVIKNKIFAIKNRKYYKNILEDFLNYIRYCSQMLEEKEFQKDSEITSVPVMHDVYNKCTLLDDIVSESNTLQHEETKHGFDNDLLKITETIISSCFVNGMRKNANIAKRKFRNAYRDLVGEDISEDIDIDALASTVGIEYANKIYVVTEANKQKIKEIVSIAVNSGNRVMFYEEIYQKNLDFMTSAGIFTADILKIVLKKTLPDMYYRRTSFSPKESDNLENDIIACYENELMLTYGDIKKRLPYADLQQIRSVCSHNSEFVWAKEETYVLTEKIHFSLVDIENSIRVISQDIKKQGFSVFHRISVVESVELNPYIPKVAIQEALFVKHLASSYERNRSIITLPGESFSVPAVMAEYCKSLKETTLSELQSYEEELTDKSIYSLFAAYDVMIRVNKDRFVSPDLIHFDVHRIDDALSLYVQGSIIPLVSVASFTSFPEVEGYTWNHFLLDSFCRHKSLRFRSLGGPAKSKPVGAIFPIHMKFDNYDELLAQVAAKSSITLNTDDVSTFFTKNGYTLRRIDTSEIVAKAQKIRIQEEVTDV